MAPPLSRASAHGVRVASVSRAMRVLDAFARHPGGIAVSRLANELGFGKASLSKILGTLERERFVRQDARTGQFHLSWRLLALAFGHAHRVGIPALCLPILQGLADETDALVQLALAEQDHLLFVAKTEGPGNGIRMLPLVGVIAPLHATASGKIWLASLPERQARAILARLELARLTRRTIVSRAKLSTELRQARRRGYAIVDEELVDGGRAVAAAIRTAGGVVVGAVAASGPTFSLSVADLRRIAPRVRRAAEELGAIWPFQVSASDFGLGVAPARNGAVKNGAARGTS